MLLASYASFCGGIFVTLLGRCKYTNSNTLDPYISINILPIHFDEAHPPVASQKGCKATHFWYLECLQMSLLYTHTLSIHLSGGNRSLRILKAFSP